MMTCFEMRKSNCERVTCVILTIRIFHCNAFRWTKYINLSLSIFHRFAKVMCYVMKTHLLILWFPLGNIVHSEGVISSTFPDELSALHSVHSRGCPSTGRLSAVSRQTSAGRCALTSPLHSGNGNSPRWLENSHQGASLAPDPGQHILFAVPPHSYSHCCLTLKHTQIKGALTFSFDPAILSDAVV